MKTRPILVVGVVGVVGGCRGHALGAEASDAFRHKAPGSNASPGKTQRPTNESSVFDGDGEEKHSLEHVNTEETRAAICSFDTGALACTSFFTLAYSKSGTIDYYRGPTDASDLRALDNNELVRSVEQAEIRWSVSLDFNDDRLRFHTEKGSLSARDAKGRDALAKAGTYAW